MKKILYVVYTENMSEEIPDAVGSGDVFADESGNIIAFVHSSDGVWRDEYFNHILEHYGVCVQKPDTTMLNTIEDNFKKYWDIE